MGAHDPARSCHGGNAPRDDDDEQCENEEPAYGLPRITA
jgi:hypothetical protein